MELGRGLSSRAWSLEPEAPEHCLECALPDEGHGQVLGPSPSPLSHDARWLRKPLCVGSSRAILFSCLGTSAPPWPTPCRSFAYFWQQGAQLHMAACPFSKQFNVYYEILKLSQIFKELLINISLIIKYLVQRKAQRITPQAPERSPLQPNMPAALPGARGVPGGMGGLHPAPTT